MCDCVGSYSEQQQQQLAALPQWNVLAPVLEEASPSNGLSMELHQALYDTPLHARPVSTHYNIALPFFSPQMAPKSGFEMCCAPSTDRCWWQPPSRSQNKQF